MAPKTFFSVGILLLFMTLLSFAHADRNSMIVGGVTDVKAR
jgi:hypothetical protein